MYAYYDRPYDAKNPFMAPVAVHRELHKSGDRSCMHIEFDISGSKLRYDAGDHVAVFPTNDADIVEKLGARLSADLGTVFTLTNLDGSCFLLLDCFTNEITNLSVNQSLYQNIFHFSGGLSSGPTASSTGDRP